MRARVVSAVGALLALAALRCVSYGEVDPPIGLPEGGTPDDATSTDGSSIGEDGAIECAWKPRHFDACALPKPSPTLALNAKFVFDTDIPGFVGAPLANPPAMTIATGAVVIHLESLVVERDATLRVIGSKPLIIASASTIEIDGVIDVSSRRGEPFGAGANPAACDATKAVPGANETTTGGGSGGGGGGAFQGSGGGGGPGGALLENPGGIGGKHAPVPRVVRGGCNGAASGKAGPDPQVSPPSNANTVALGGAGGGAIQLTARTSITIRGVVVASGAGGEGAPLHSATGGGGGGSGGYIGFDAPKVSFIDAARIVANGGGGGASEGFAGAGAHGADGHDDAVTALGGIAASCGGGGGAGSAQTTFAGFNASPTASSCGGGGGGGGAGYIMVHAQESSFTASVVFSPPARDD